MAQLARGQSSYSHPGGGRDVPGPAYLWSRVGAELWAWCGSPALCCSVLASSYLHLNSGRCAMAADTPCWRETRWMLLGGRIKGEWLCPSLCCGHLCSLFSCDPLLSTPINICLLHCALLLTWAPAPTTPGAASISHKESGSCGSGAWCGSCGVGTLVSTTGIAVPPHEAQSTPSSPSQDSAWSMGAAGC